MDMNKSTMLLVILSLLMLTAGVLPAAYLHFEPQELCQPDGTRLDLYASGDEYYNWLHDKDGYTIRQNSSGWYVYLEKISKDELGFTQWVVGRDNPSEHNLTPWITISAEKIGEMRRSAEQQLTAIGAGRAPTSGNLNNLVIFIRFADQAEFTQTISTYSAMFNGTTGNTMQNYFSEVSYGALNVTTTFYPAPTTYVVSWQDTHIRNYFVPYDASTNPSGYNGDTERRLREHQLLVDAVNGVSSQIPTGLNLDGDNDGMVDNVCFIIQGATTAWATLLWPHRWALYTYTVNINGKRVYDYNFQLSNSLSSSGASVLAHEMFHSLGAPDLYHYTSDGISPADKWDLMCSNTTPPQHMTAFMKWKYGHWISDIPTLYTSGTYTLNPLTSPAGQCFRINSPVSSTEYYVVEFRKKTGTFESSIYGSGIIIYRINTTCGNGNADGPPDELYIYRPGGTTTANGTPSTAYFSSESGRTAFNNNTNPTCFLTDGTLGNISISSIGSSAGSTMSFYYTMDNAPLNLSGSSSNSTIVLNWQAPPNGTPSSYKIYRNGSYLGSSTTLSYTDASVIIGNSYSYYVTAMFTNPTAETAASNTVNVTASDISVIGIGTESNTGKGLPIEPYYGYTYSQSIYLQSEINTANKSISKLAWKYNGNSAWTDAIKIYMGHTSLTSFANTSSWIPLSNLTLVYDGTLTTTTTAGWVEVTLNTPFAYNNVDNLVIAVDENTSGYHNTADEFYNTSTSGNRSLHYFNNSSNPDPASPPTSGTYLYLKAFVPNVNLTFSTYPQFTATPTAVDFGNVMVSTLETRTLRLTNTGNGVLTISAIQLSNASFYLSGVPTLPRSLSGGQYLEFQVNYYPQTVLTSTATVNVTDNQSRLLRTVNITATSFNATNTTFPWTLTCDTWLPEHWSLSGGTRNWSQYTVATDGNKCAMANLWSWTVPNNAVLITPPQRTTTMSKLTFRWSHLYNATYPNDSLKIYYSVNRVNWTLLWQKGGTELNSNDGATNTTPGSFVQTSVSLPSGHTDQTFFIKFEAISGYGPNLFIDDITIKSAQLMTVTPTTFTFGSVAVGTSSTQVMVMKNVGDETATGYFNTLSVYTASIQARDTELRNRIDFSILPGDSLLVNLTITPLAAATYNSTFYILSNDPIQPNRLIRLYGSGYLPARISVSPGVVADTVSGGSSCTRNLVVQNTGSQLLTFSIQVTEPNRNITGRDTSWLSLSSLSGSVGVGQSQTITMTMNSQSLSPGLHSAELNITSNDPVNPMLPVLVNLSVIPAPPVPAIQAQPGGLTISWSEVPGAVAYKIFSSNTPDGEFQLLATVTQTTYLSPGTAETHFYRIVAVLP
jgi:M6 family metalloprotease-like protein